MTKVPERPPTAGFMISVGAPVTVQPSVLAWPAVTCAGVAAKLVMVGTFPATTVTLAVVAPKLLVAVSVYVAVVEGVTLTDVPVTAPTPGVTVRLGKPVTVQLSVLDWPVVTFAGVAMKLVMVGGLPARSVTEAVVDPKSLVAVKV